MLPAKVLSEMSEKNEQFDPIAKSSDKAFV